MGSSLFGSAPKASFSTQPTILPQQQNLLTMLEQLLTTGTPPPGVTPYGGTFAAPLNSLQTTSLAGLEQIAAGGTAPGQPAPITKTPQQTDAINQSFNTLNEALGYTAPQIDSTAAFQQGVVDPLTENFNTNVLPSLDARYAGSAGGAYSSGRQEANAGAADDFTDSLSQAGSTFAYNTSTANQQAELQANQQRLAALGLAPAITGLPTALDAGIQSANDASAGNWIQRLLSTLGGGSVPYNVAQTELSGQYGEFQRQQESIQQFLRDFIAAATGTTQTTIGVGSAGSSGLLGGLTSAVGPIGAALVKSDVRLKEDIEQIGDVGGIPLYRYRYIGEPERHIGFMAQDMERRLPSAVHTMPDGYKAIDYGTVIADLLEAA